MVFLLRKWHYGAFHPYAAASTFPGDLGLDIPAFSHVGRKELAGNILPHETMMTPLLPFFKVQKVTLLQKRSTIPCQKILFTFRGLSIGKAMVYH